MLQSICHGSLNLVWNMALPAYHHASLENLPCSSDRMKQTGFRELRSTFSSNSPSLGQRQRAPAPRTDPQRGGFLWRGHQLLELWDAMQLWIET